MSDENSQSSVRCRRRIEVTDFRADTRRQLTAVAMDQMLDIYRYGEWVGTLISAELAEKVVPLRQYPRQN